MRYLRILRAILATAVTWGVAWIPFSLLPLTIVALAGGEIPSARVLALIALGQGITGAINGTVFASVVVLMGRRKTFDSISLRWMAACGAVGGALFPFAVRSVVIATTSLPLPVTSLVIGAVTNAVLGAGFAAIALSVARRAPALSPGKTPGDVALNSGAA